MDSSWANTEFFSVDLGDARLNRRLSAISRRFAESPLSPINQACDDWAETKAAYRFFANDRITHQQITRSHIAATRQRCSDSPTVLAIQDTTYFNYSQHPQTNGLCPLSRNKGRREEDIPVLGLIMHSTFAVGSDGLPLGIVDQKIYSRAQPDKPMSAKQRRAHNDKTPIEDKDSYRWLEALENTTRNLAGLQGQVVTIADREADIYDLFLHAQDLCAPLVVRANYNRTVNKKTRYSQSTGTKLWTFLRERRVQTTIQVEVAKSVRTATCDVRFAEVVVNPPNNYCTTVKPAKPRNLNLYAVYVSERECPAGAEPIDWMLLTNMPVAHLEQALEKVAWYCLRWRIETWHKVLKSGLRVEDCRLSTADRLQRYLAVMSIVAWRILWTTIVARVAPEATCRLLLNDQEWTILAAKFSSSAKASPSPPSLKQAVSWIAQLGGFLARNPDKDPGITHIWRGVKKLSAMVEGAELVKGLVGNR